MNQTWTRYPPSFIQQKLEGRHALQKAISNTGWQFADNIMRMGVGLFVGVWVARYLGPEQYGVFSYALAFVALFASVASIGLDEIATRNIVRDPAAKDKILGTTFVLKLIAGIVIFAATIGAIFVLRPVDSLAHWLIGIIAAGTVFQAFSTIELWFHSQVQAKYTVLAKSIAFILSSFIKIGLIIAKAPLIAFAMISTVEVIISSTGFILAYRSNGCCMPYVKIVTAVMTILLFSSVPYLFKNESRPLWGDWSIVTVDRERLYFVNKPSIEPYYFKAADYFGKIGSCRNIRYLQLLWRHL